MKLKLLFFAFIFTTTIFSQGIAVQGIARNITESAITDTTLNFEISIVDENGVILFKEEESIRTDNFGVFSHIVGNGDPIANTFNSVNFALKGLKIKITITDDGQTVVVYNLPFQYVPYAKYADNGVPTGSIIPFAGTEAPEGYLLCNGDPFDKQVYTSLYEVLGANKTPDLRGRVLEGTGTSLSSSRYVGPSLNSTHGDSNKDHKHGSGTLRGDTNDSTGNHSHRYDDRSQDDNGTNDDRYSADAGDGNAQADTNRSTGSGGAHNHEVDVYGYTNDSGSDEVRVASYGVNYIIKI